MAKAAELNGYPGPAQVLELVRQLPSTSDQLRDVTAIRDRMSATARRLGSKIEREHELDQLFAQGEIRPERLVAKTAAIGELQGRLRSVHVAVHLEVRALLTPAQITRYRQRPGATASTPCRTIPILDRHCRLPIGDPLTVLVIECRKKPLKRLQLDTQIGERRFHSANHLWVFSSLT